ncbi:DNA-binding IclR family transcriptional regulator [Robbsia andropogonis]|uniref:hypothetical protein n=1 Tax=Robbsia andropogonis TaxID=28092 RepID=UPI003D1B0BD8
MNVGSAPVFGVNWKFLGALCVSGPISRVTDSVLRKFVPDVVEAGKRLSYNIAASGGEAVPVVVRQAWHP